MKMYIYTTIGYEFSPEDCRIGISEKADIRNSDEIVYSCYESEFLHMMVLKVEKVTGRKFNKENVLYPDDSAQVVDTEIIAYLTGDFDKDQKMRIPFNYKRVINSSNPFDGFTEMSVSSSLNSLIR